MKRKICILPDYAVYGSVKVFLSLSLFEILKCSHSNESCQALILFSAINAKDEVQGDF